MLELINQNHQLYVLYVQLYNPNTPKLIHVVYGLKLFGIWLSSCINFSRFCRGSAFRFGSVIFGKTTVEGIMKLTALDPIALRICRVTRLVVRV